MGQYGARIQQPGVKLPLRDELRKVPAVAEECEAHPATCRRDRPDGYPILDTPTAQHREPREEDSPEGHPYAVIDEHTHDLRGERGAIFKLSCQVEPYVGQEQRAQVTPSCYDRCPYIFGHVILHSR